MHMQHLNKQTMYQPVNLASCMIDVPFWQIYKLVSAQVDTLPLFGLHKLP